MRSMMFSLVAALVVSAAVVGCGGDDGSSISSGESGGVTVVADGFASPTQITDGPDGLLIVAQLAGDEGAAEGEVLALDLVTGDRTVILDGLDKPTGVLWRSGEVWVMVRRGLVRASWDGTGTAGPVEVMLDDLPFNGRSQGTLTALPDGRILYETSGSIASGEVVTGSGVLWAFDPSDGSSTAVATGVKNAYAHALLPDGQVLVADIGDNVDPQPVEELNVVPIDGNGGGPVDLGWPACAGDASCPGVIGPLATFEPTSTPTGVAVVDGNAYVALFVTGELIRVSLATGASEVVLGDNEGLHTVLARPDGTLWLTDHLSGSILSFDPA